MNRGRGRNLGTFSAPPRGRSSRSGGRSSHRHAPSGPDGSSNNDDPFGSKDGNSHGRRQSSEWKSVGSISKKPEHEPSLGYANRQDWPTLGGTDKAARVGNLQQGQNSPEAVGSSSKQPDSSFGSDSAYEKDFHSLSAQSGPKDSRLDEGRIQIGQTPGEGAGNNIMLHLELSCKVHISCLQDESQPSPNFGINDGPSQNNGPQDEQASSGDPAGNRNSAMDAPFDICLAKSGTTFSLKPSLLVKNREKRNESKRSMEGQKGSILRPGMVLLRSYLSCADQVKIVKICRDRGLGSGGFYQPGYRDGAKLHLKMMCLGKNWDPEKSEYGEYRPIDGAKPPIIPDEFNQFVEKAIQDSHAVVRKNIKASNVEDILPSMSPDICIVNFYAATGRLGLHQDRDESRGSLMRGLPVVSFSIGDSAEFLFGDQKDADKLDKIVLESGDVLIFGGKSRHIFHGVSAIHLNTAPKALLEETNLRPGRLNLTFREY
ncbi:hypothetical protein L1049_003782 [Liquidambar formosana]|uniref:DNA N(6)-methyladenine demethylase n=1 Tax=Liquidambar formosana TaxID=63359 RepID=A0AAP0RSR2_LIQFO